MIQVTYLLKRKAGLSLEGFTKYWSEIHGPLFSSTKVVQEKLISYTQIHVLESESSVFQQAGAATSQWDGMAVFTVEKIEDLLAVLDSEEYQTKIVEDEDKFLDRASTQIVIGGPQSFLSQRKLVL